MYKGVYVHEIVPGKFSEFKRWCRNADQERRERDPDYTPPKRYITVIGNLTRFYGEFDLGAVPEHPGAWSEMVERQGGFKELVIPGKSELYVLKEVIIED